MSESKTFKSCFIPLCGSSSVKTPNKLFFCAPKDEKMRLKWFQIARRNDSPKAKYTYYCCEDHFSIKDDMDNYIRYCLMGAPKKLKKDAIPHKFSCQPNRIKVNEEARPAFIKLNRKRQIHDILAETENEENIPEKQHDQPAAKIRKNYDTPVELLTDLTNQEQLHEMSSHEPLTSEIEKNPDVPLSIKLSSTQIDLNFSTENESLNSEKLSPAKINCEQKNQKSVGVQVRKSFMTPNVRSKHTMCKPNTREVSCEVKVEMVNKMCSPIKFHKTESTVSTLINSDSSTPVSSSNTTGEYKYSSISSEYKKSSTCSEEKNEKQKEMKKSVLDITLYLISLDPKNILVLKMIGYGFYLC
ncbi:uncharacterized protein LOC122513005 [Leptopilina heterotoma]|uniref:uncharacterized protein LOC122513005 n=1 Tax=Leptopilina heterotoma TaxID=63436 RepID=UPI001CA9E5AC|nr:uncharacterized protein LOC122513005 [Leptopilina heterotoma]